MAELVRLRAFAVRQALTHLGGMPAVKTYEWLQAYCADPNQRLPKAVKQATEQTWQALSIALDEPSGLSDRLKRAFAPGVVKGMVTPLRSLIAERDTEFRQGCRAELAQITLETGIDSHWQQAVADCPSFTTPSNALQHSRNVTAEEANSLREAGLIYLPQLLELELPHEGGSLLLHVFNSFLRAAVADNPELSQLLSFNLLEDISEQQSYALELLEEIRQRLPDTLKQEPIVQPGHTAILSSLDDERVFNEFLARLQALPEAQRDPDLVDNLGRLGMAVGQFPEAQRLFTTSAERQTEPSAQAEAHYNAHRAALEQRQWETATEELLKAAALDPERFEPFPLRKYQIEKILGSGGFGTAFLCKDQHLNAQVVIKTLHQATLERDTQDIFREAQILQKLRHPAIVEITHCDFADRGQTRPYLVMMYFESIALDDYLDQYGQLNARQVRQFAKLLAQGLEAAHSQGILHRDLKPANILLQRSGGKGKVRIIDFGLALQVKQVRDSVLASQLSKSLLSESAGGTYQYAAPEQMGLLPGSVGTYSDVFGYGKTLCYSLFLTASPTLRDWQKLAQEDQTLAELLSDCIEEDSTRRPQDFTAVLKRLNQAKDEAKQRAAFEAEQAEQQRLDEQQAALEAQQAEQRRLARESRSRSTQAPTAPPSRWRRYVLGVPLLLLSVGLGVYGFVLFFIEDRLASAVQENASIGNSYPGLNLPNFYGSLIPQPGWRRDPSIGQGFNAFMLENDDKTVYLSVYLTEKMIADLSQRDVFTVQTDIDDINYGGNEYLLHRPTEMPNSFELDLTSGQLSGYFKIWGINGPRQGFMSVNLSPVRAE